MCTHTSGHENTWNSGAGDDQTIQLGIATHGSHCLHLEHCFCCLRICCLYKCFLSLLKTEKKNILQKVKWPSKSCTSVPCVCGWLSSVTECFFYSVFPGAFFLYSSMALVGFFFFYGCLPETKARRLEEIEALFENQLCSCGASDSDEGRQVEYIRVKGSNYHLSDNDASDVD